MKFGKEEREFLINEFIERDKRELIGITKAVIKKPRLFDRKAAFLKKFTIDMSKAYYNLYYKPRFVKKAVKKEIKYVIKTEIKKPKFIKKIKLEKTKLEEAPKPVFEEGYRSIFLEGIPIKLIYSKGKYKLEEPELSENDKDVVFKLKKKLGNKVYKKGRLDEKDFREKMEKYARKFKINVDDDYYNKIKYNFVRDVLGYGRIEILLKDKNVSEIICNGINQPILIKYKNHYDVETNIEYKDEKQINEIIDRFSRLAGKKLEKKNPFLTANIDIGRVQANITTKLSGAKYAIRKKEVKNG